MSLPYTEMHIEHPQYIQIEEAEWKHPSAEKGAGGPESITSNEFHRRAHSLWFRCSREQGVPRLSHIGGPPSNPQPWEVGAIIFCNNGFKSVKYDPLLDPNQESDNTEYWEPMGFKLDLGRWIFGRVEPNLGYEQDIPKLSSAWYRYLFKGTRHAEAGQNHRNSEALHSTALTSYNPLWIWGLAAFYFSQKDLAKGFDQIFNPSHNPNSFEINPGARYSGRTIIVRGYDQYPPALMLIPPSQLS